MNKLGENVFHSGINKLSDLQKNGDNHGVIQLGMSLYLSSHATQEEIVDTMPLAYVKAAITNIFKHLADQTPRIESTNHSCSFCGLSPPNVKLGAGPDVFICNQCVDRFAEVFGSNI